MSNIDIFKAGIAAFESRDEDKVNELVADDFQLSGPVQQPLGKRAFVGQQLALVAAMPDWKFNASDFKQAGGRVSAKVNISGTQTAALCLPALGIQSFAATGRQVQLPHEQITATIQNGKLTRLETAPVVGGGVTGVLEQIGAARPTHSPDRIN